MQVSVLNRGLLLQHSLCFPSFRRRQQRPWSSDPTWEPQLDAENEVEPQIITHHITIISLASVIGGIVRMSSFRELFVQLMVSFLKLFCTQPEGGTGAWISELGHCVSSEVVSPPPSPLGPAVPTVSVRGCSLGCLIWP